MITKGRRKQDYTAIKDAGQADETTQKKINFRTCIAICFIVIITFIVFFPSFKCGFTNWDDEDYVTKNSLVVSNFIHVKEIFKTPVLLNYHPITMLTFALNYQFGKLNPVGYHLWNVLLHVLNTILVFVFIFIFTKRNLLMATIVALFFGIHPMHVESVAWVSERKDVLYVFFFLAALISYLYYKEKGKPIWYSITLLLFILSCLSKAMAVVFPFVLILIDYYTADSISQIAIWKRKTSIDKIPFFLISLVFGITAYVIQHNGKAMEFMNHFTSFQRLFFASYGAIMYLLKFIVPYNLSAFYTYPNLNSISFIFYFSPVIFLCIIAMVYFFMRKNKAIIFGLLFYFVSVVLVLQFVGVGNAIMADRYSYLSYIGLLFIVAHFINLVWQKKRFKYAVTGITCIYTFIFSCQSYARTKIWLNSETLWTDAINKNPTTCSVAYNYRGSYYQFLNTDINIEKALLDYNKAIEIYSDFPAAYINKGLIYYNQNKYELAMENFNKVIELNPNNSIAYNNRGLVYEKEEKYDLAMNEYNKATQLNPGYELVYFNRGNLYLNLRKYDLAMADFDKIILLNPSNSNAYADKALIYFTCRQYDLALIQFSKAIELDSTVAAYWLYRSMSYNALGKKEEAKADALKTQQLGMTVETGYLNGLGIQ